MTFDLDDLDLWKNEPLELISGAALNLPTKFGEDRPKDLGEVGEQTEKNINLTFDLDDLDLSKNKPLKLISGAALHLPSKFGEDRPKDLGGVGEQTNKQTDKRCSNYSMIFRSRHVYELPARSVAQSGSPPQYSSLETPSGSNDVIEVFPNTGIPYPLS